MEAILFGSIGTLADTSELQRQAFNQAFVAHQLDWHWDRTSYSMMLECSGGQQRITHYANSLGKTVDAAAIHHTKSTFFQNSLTPSQVSPRPGVLDIIEGAKCNGIKLGFVTTTTQDNVSRLLQALFPKIDRTDFDVITHAALVQHPKPDADAYHFALKALDESASASIAIEDNLDGLASAVSAGLNCVAFPNTNTAHHDFSKARWVVDRLDFQALQGFFSDAKQ